MWPDYIHTDHSCYEELSHLPQKDYLVIFSDFTDEVEATQGRR